MSLWISSGSGNNWSERTIHLFFHCQTLQLPFIISHCVPHSRCRLRQIRFLPHPSLLQFVINIVIFFIHNPPIHCRIWTSAVQLKKWKKCNFQCDEIVSIKPEFSIIFVDPLINATWEQRAWMDEKEIKIWDATGEWKLLVNNWKIGNLANCCDCDMAASLYCAYSNWMHADVERFMYDYDIQHCNFNNFLTHQKKFLSFDSIQIWTDNLSRFYRITVDDDALHLFAICDAIMIFMEFSFALSHHHQRRHRALNVKACCLLLVELVECMTFSHFFSFMFLFLSIAVLNSRFPLKLNILWCDWNVNVSRLTRANYWYRKTSKLSPFVGEVLLSYKSWNDCNLLKIEAQKQWNRCNRVDLILKLNSSKTYILIISSGKVKFSSNLI